jgi:SAM-dependent methyltransferase
VAHSATGLEFLKLPESYQILMSDFIKLYWDSQAEKYGQSHEASWADLDMVLLEIDTLTNVIPKQSTIVDAGCANGFSTARIAEATNSEMVYAFDFSPVMIAKAKNLFGTLSHLKSELFVSDIRSIQLDKAVADVCYTTRTLINLPNWADQVTAIKECLRIVRPGGICLFSEAFWEPLCRLNSIRQFAGLAPLIEHDFNRYLKLEKMKEWLTTSDLYFEIHDFSSLAYLGSRFIRELATDVDKFEGYSNPVNREFAELARKYPSCGSFGIQQLVIVRK